MPLRTVSVVRWTGSGSLSGLRSSVEFFLDQNGVRAQVRMVGNSLLVAGPEPLGVASLLAHMPGVSWIAAGLAVRSMKEASESARWLASRYLRKGDRFLVEAEGTKGVVRADVAGAITSAMLESVKGSKVSLESPKVRFKAAFDGTQGVIGVEIRAGPGGVTMGREWAVCLVSGGMHSSVLAWNALLAGYRVRLICHSSSEKGLLSVARLYSELCHRADSRGMKLDVLEGGAPKEVLRTYLESVTTDVFGGFHRLKGRVPESLTGVRAPLYLLPEEVFHSEFESLGLKEDKSETDWNDSGKGKFTVRGFEGWAEDLSAVLDGLR